VSIQRRAATALSLFREAIRAEVRDPETDRSGVAKASAALRWSNHEIDNAFQLAIEDLQRDLSERNPGERLVAVDTTFTAGSASITLPTGLTNASLIYKVEDITDSSRPLALEYVSPLEIERFASPVAARPVPWMAGRWSIAASGTDLAILVRPKPSSDMALRISGLVSPTIVTSSSDAHPLTGQWYELIALMVAQRLLRPDDEFSAQQQQSLEHLREQMLASSSRAGPQRIRTRRRFRA